jgi:predicted MPP superfamily phosphohydrolase
MKQIHPFNDNTPSYDMYLNRVFSPGSLRALHPARQKSPLWLNWGKKTQFVLRYFMVYDARIHNEVRLAIVSDLHGAMYGEKQSEIVAALGQERPHVVLLLGDIFDHRGIDDNAKALISVLSGRFSCYFVPGNHEYKSGEMREIRSLLDKANIPILAGDCATISVNQTKIEIFGVDDAMGGMVRQRSQLSAAKTKRCDDVFSVLAIHSPNDVAQILPFGFDLMLSGHTHGGQFVIPHLFNGLYAPGQGVFPKYGGGRYDFASQVLIICRGLSQAPLWLPRLGNPPELCFVTLKGQETT